MNLKQYVSQTSWVMEESALMRLDAMIRAGKFDGEKLLEGVPTSPAPFAAQGPGHSKVRTSGYWNIGGVAVIDVNGVLCRDADAWYGPSYECATDDVRRAVQEARKDSTVHAGIVQIHSPGGAVQGVPELADVLYQWSQEQPVVCQIHSISCSGGYWLASQCGSIYCGETDWVGGIGVYLVLDDTSEMFKSFGVERRVIKSTPLKAAGLEGTPVEDEHVATFQRMIDQTHAVFASAVQRGRKLTDEQIVEIADARVHIGQQAIDVGLVDGIQTFEETLERLQASLNGDGNQSGAMTMSSTTKTVGSRSKRAGAKAEDAVPEEDDEAKSQEDEDEEAKSQEEEEDEAKSQEEDDEEEAKQAAKAKSSSPRRRRSEKVEKSHVAAMREAFPDDPDWAMDAISQGLSLAQAKAMHRPAETESSSAPIGARAVESRPGRANVTNDGESPFRAAIRAKMRETGMSWHKAARAVVVENPKLQREHIEAANAR